MSSEPRFSNATMTVPESTPIVVRCIVVTDRHGDTHAFAFDRTPHPKFGAIVESFHEFTKQVHEWAQTQPFDKGEVLTVATSALEDPGAARLGPKLTWGEYRVEK